MKKLVSLTLSLLFAFSFTVSASATGNELDVSPIPSDAIKISLKNPGDTQIISQDEFDTIFVTLVDSSEEVNDLTRAGTVKTVTRNYMITYTNILGQTKDGVAITSTCTWLDNGSQSALQNLNCSYTIKDNSFSCKWNSDYKVEGNGYYLRLGLDVSRLFSTTTYLLDAALIITDTNPDVYDVDLGFWHTSAAS